MNDENDRDHPRRPSASRGPAPDERLGDNGSGYFTAAALAAPFVIWLIWAAVRAGNPVDRDFCLGGILAVGGFIACMLIVGAKQRTLFRDISRMARMFPEQPWRRWSGWEQAEVPNQKGRRPVASWLLTLASAGLGIGIASEIFGETPISAESWIVFGCVVGAGLLCLAWAVYSTVNSIRFREMVLRLDTFPVRPGETLAGEIVLPRAGLLRSGTRARLRCQKRNRTSANRTSGARNAPGEFEHDLWTGEIEFGDGFVSSDGQSSFRLPVKADLPADLPGSSSHPRGPGVFWQLEIAGWLGFVGRIGEFPVPVIRPEPDR